MARVCITGHRPDPFLVSHYQADAVVRLASDIACILKREYGDELLFNLGGAIGADQWMGAAAIEHSIKFGLFLPFLPQIQARFWTDEQRLELDRQLRAASRITIVDSSGDYDVVKYHERDRLMVDEADFVVAFWVGRKRGGTFETMKYALSKSKFVFNALDGLRPVFKQNLETGWTPPHLRKEDVNNE
jgi:uncharacterized phage-like protein YoqJ